VGLGNGHNVGCTVGDCKGLNIGRLVFTWDGRWVGRQVGRHIGTGVILASDQLPLADVLRDCPCTRCRSLTCAGTCTLLIVGALLSATCLAIMDSSPLKPALESGPTCVVLSADMSVSVPVFTALSLLSYKCDFGCSRTANPDLLIPLLPSAASCNRLVGSGKAVTTMLTLTPRQAKVRVKRYIIQFMMPSIALYPLC
jgi:hypothetical protein